MSRFRFAVLIVFAGLFGAGASQAAAPLVSDTGGTWNVTFYRENARTVGKTQCIIFTRVPGAVAGVGTSGTWYSPTFAGWRGHWIQLGDHVRFVGITGSLATSGSGNVISAQTIGGVSFNHFNVSTAANSSAGSFTAARGTCPPTNFATQKANGDPSQ